MESRPKATTEFVVREESPLESAFSISSITPEQIAVWVRERSIDPEIEKSLQAIADKKSEINDLTRKSPRSTKSKTRYSRTRSACGATCKD